MSWGVAEDPLRDRPAADQAQRIAVERVVRLVRQSNFRGRRASIALKPPEVAFHAATVPDAFFTVPHGQRLTMLRFEAARQMQAAPEELEVDFWRLPPGNRAGHNVVIAAAKREAVVNWVRRLAQVGLELSLVDELPCALIRSAWRVGLPGRTDRPPEECLWGVLDIGFSGALLAVALGSQCVYVRTMTAGGDSLSSAIENAVRVNYGAAEILKRQYQPPRAASDRSLPAAPLSPSSPTVAAARPDGLAAPLHALLRTRLRMLAVDTERAFAYAMESYPTATPVGLYLCGGGAKLAGLPELLAEWLGIEIRMLNPCENVPVEPGNPPVHGAYYPNMAACMGLALREVA